MEDCQIVALFHRRSETAIAAAAEKYGAYCHSIAFRILQNDHDADECVNDAYLSAWNAIPPHNPERLSTFLGKLTRNHALNRYKFLHAAKRGGGQVEVVLSELEDCLPVESDAEQALEDELIVKALNEFLHSQPAEKRNIFLRRYWKLESIQEIALSCGMSESKVTSLLLRMRRELKKHLEQEDIYL